MNDNYILALDGEAILLKNSSISLKWTIVEDDQSGQSSATTASEQGQKAKVLNISGLIEYKNIQRLERLRELSSQIDAAGRKQIFRIANALAQSFKFRQGVFAGEISAVPDGKYLAWQVSFSIKERFSVPEKREAIERPQEQEQVIDDEIIQEEAQELSSFEQLLKKMDDALA